MLKVVSNFHLKIGNPSYGQKVGPNQINNLILDHENPKKGSNDL
jgi:hypothetical protein